MLIASLFVIISSTESNRKQPDGRPDIAARFMITEETDSNSMNFVTQRNDIHKNGTTGVEPTKLHHSNSQVNSTGSVETTASQQSDDYIDTLSIDIIDLIPQFKQADKEISSVSFLNTMPLNTKHSIIETIRRKGGIHHQV